MLDSADLVGQSIDLCLQQPDSVPESEQEQDGVAGQVLDPVMESDDVTTAPVVHVEVPACTSTDLPHVTVGTRQRKP